MIQKYVERTPTLKQKPSINTLLFFHIILLTIIHFTNKTINYLDKTTEKYHKTNSNISLFNFLIE